MKGKFILFCLVIFVIAGRAQTIRNFNVVLRSNFGSDTMWDNLDVPIYSMNASLSSEPKIPARVLYCNEGDSVVLNALSLAQGEHHTVHLHGLDVDTRNDGDPMTSFWLEHLQDTTYSFKATHAGTYLYHCHVADVVHVQMGMYGLIVVKAANGQNTAWTGGPAFDRDVHWLMSELDSSWHFNVPSHDPTMDTVNIPPYHPTYFLLNGKSEWQLDNNDSVRISGLVGNNIYLRLANIGFYANKVIFPTSLDAHVIDTDGRPIPLAIDNDTVYVQPGERYGVMLHASEAILDSIPVHFVNMNTGLTENIQWAPLQINGLVGLYPNDAFSEYEVYPNPFSGHLTFDLKRKGRYFVRVFNVMGSLAHEFISDEDKTELNTEYFLPGVYFVEIRNTSGSSVWVKVIRS